MDFKIHIVTISGCFGPPGSVTGNARVTRVCERLCFVTDDMPCVSSVLSAAPPVLEAPPHTHFPLYPGLPSLGTNVLQVPTRVLDYSTSCGCLLQIVPGT